MRCKKHNERKNEYLYYLNLLAILEYLTIS
jgi:hypothetical protein